MVTDGDQVTTGPERELALDCIVAAIDAAAPETATLSVVGLDGDSPTVAGAAYDLTRDDVVGARKTSDGVTRALETVSDAGTYLSDVGATVRTGPTGSDVDDVIVMVVPGSSERS